MIALFQMTNPLWEFLIAPFLIGGIGCGIGWRLRGALDRSDSRDPDAPGPYDWADEEDSQ